MWQVAVSGHRFDATGLAEKSGSLVRFYRLSSWGEWRTRRSVNIPEQSIVPSALGECVGRNPGALPQAGMECAVARQMGRKAADFLLHPLRHGNGKVREAPFLPEFIE